MLYTDLIKYRYAYFMDANLNLTYEMFCSYSGKINNLGIRNIFECLQNEVQRIQNLYVISFDCRLTKNQSILRKCYISVQTQTDKTFFR